MDEQVSEFQESLAEPPDNAQWSATNSMFVVWFGVNDLERSYYHNRQSSVNDEIFGSYFEQLDIMYNIGARRFMLFNMPRKFCPQPPLHYLP